MFKSNNSRNNPKVEKLLKSDIHFLQALQPPGWDDIRPLFNKFMGKSYFEAFKIELDNQMVAASQVIYHQTTTWLGNIVVHPEFQNRGLGTHITSHLIDFINQKKPESMLLLATDAGKKIYDKFGFKVYSEYAFFRRESKSNLYSSIYPIELCPAMQRDFDEICMLDYETYGENRISLLLDFLPKTFIVRSHMTKDLLAYYIPALGQGQIVSKSNELGLKLLDYHIEKRDLIAVPVENTPAVKYLEYKGFNYFRNAHYMVMGKEIIRKPEYIYSRIGGYLG